MKIAATVLWSLLGLLAAVILFYVVAGLLVNPKKRYETDSRFYRKLLIGTTGFGLWLLRIRIHTTGLDRVPKDTPCLFVANHRSNYDPLVMWYIFREKPMAFIAKPSLFRIPVFGRIIWRCLFMPIDRVSARNAIKTFDRATDLMVSKGISVGVYPEGTRCKSGDMLPFHNGVFRIAQKAEVPIVTVALRGTQTIAKNLPLRASDIHLDVVDVVMPSEHVGVRSREVGARVRQAIEQQLELEEC